MRQVGGQAGGSGSQMGDALRDRRPQGAWLKGWAGAHQEPIAVREANLRGPPGEHQAGRSCLRQETRRPSGLCGGKRRFGHGGGSPAQGGGKRVGVGHSRIHIGSTAGSVASVANEGRM
jgi:hypothetical protein